MTLGERLTGCHAVVVGAVGAAGRSVAVALAEAGARVSLTTLNLDSDQEFAANSILNEVWSMGRTGVALRLDASSAPALGAGLKKIHSEIGTVDVVVLMPGATTPSVVGGRTATITVREGQPGFEIDGGGAVVSTDADGPGEAVAGLVYALTQE